MKEPERHTFRGSKETSIITAVIVLAIIFGVLLNIVPIVDFVLGLISGG